LFNTLFGSSSYCFANGKKKHGEVKPFVFGLIGIVVMMSAVLFEMFFDLHIEKLEVILTTIGCVLLMIAHFYNIKYLSSPSCCETA